MLSAKSAHTWIFLIPVPNVARETKQQYHDLGAEESGIAPARRRRLHVVFKTRKRKKKLTRMILPCFFVLLEVTLFGLLLLSQAEHPCITTRSHWSNEEITIDDKGEHEKFHVQRVHGVHLLPNEGTRRKFVSYFFVSRVWQSWEGREQQKKETCRKLSCCAFVTSRRHDTTPERQLSLLFLFLLGW